MNTKILNALKTFNDEEQLILQLYFYEHLTIEEISMVLQVTEERVTSTYDKLLILVGLKK